MNPIVFHFASGHAFFTGMLLLLLATGASCSSSDWAKRITVTAFTLGVATVVLSATPIPYWCYALVAISAICWVSSYFYEDGRKWCRIGFSVSCLVALMFEMPHHIYWGIDPVADREIAIVADSITAGMGGGDSSKRWPHLLAQEYDLAIQDFSHPGETASSAHERVQDQLITASLVIVEIGGNDLLGSTTSRAFRKDLDRLLAHLSDGKRQIIMFELPLPPLRNEYGRIQRELARKHDVVLIPKRVLLGVLAPKENTVDTVHLTQKGHQAMADSVWSLLEPAY